MTRSVLTASVLCTLAVIAGAATAQTAPRASDQPIQIGADGGERTTTGFSLRGRAEVTQGQNRLRADAITGVNEAGGGVTSVTAAGNVYYVTPTETIRGDRATYTVANATIVVTGDVILTQGKNVLTGGRLTYNIDTGAANMDGGGPGSSGSRIQGVFYPQGSGG